MGGVKDKKHNSAKFPRPAAALQGRPKTLLAASALPRCCFLSPIPLLAGASERDCTRMDSQGRQKGAPGSALAALLLSSGCGHVRGPTTKPCEVGVGRT